MKNIFTYSVTKKNVDNEKALYFCVHEINTNYPVKQSWVFSHHCDYTSNIALRFNHDFIQLDLQFCSLVRLCAAGCVRLLARTLQL
jgi:hypothetical protein